MDAATPERQGPPVHGLVSAARAGRALLFAAVAAVLVTGVCGGLLRAGWLAAAAGHADWLGRAALWHAALMICGFMGTVIGIERAVAARHPAAWLAPATSALAAVLLLAGAFAPAAWLLVFAALAFTVVNLLLVARQPAAHTALLLASACAWLAGTVLFALEAPATAVLPWWFAFLIMTVGAERLEMTRLMRRRPGAQPLLFAILAGMGAGAALSLPAPAAGGAVFGAALVALAAWLFTFDLARRTVRLQALTRFMAVCLLAGYAWLAAGGVPWALAANGWPCRDLALHALGLGFLVSMIMGHAPVILPAIARVKLLFGPWFYVPLAALHASLLLRLGPGLADPRWRAAGALLNAVSLLLFALTMVGAALAWRRRHVR